MSEAIKTIRDLIRACESGMNWMEQVNLANLTSATRGILTTDMGMCSVAICKAKELIESLEAPNAEVSASGVNNQKP